MPGAIEIALRARKELARGEPEIRYARDHLTDKAKSFIDIGANRGWWSYILASRFREVHAFEPNPKVYRSLRKWGRRNVFKYDAALSDSDGRAELRVPRGSKGFSNQGASLSTDKIPDDTAFGGIDVRTGTLDGYGFRDVGLIKIDVEGHEDKVVRGARDTLARERPWLIVEIEEKHTKRPLAETVGEICGLGYECFHLWGKSLESFGPGASNEINGRYVFNFIFRPI